MDKFELATIRAEQAQALITNPMFEQAFADTRQALLETWATLDNVNSDQARDIHRRIKCLASVRKCLEEHITTGKLAQKELEGRRKLMDMNPFKRRA